MEDYVLAVLIIRKLNKKRCWGARHTSFDNLPKGFPSHMHKGVKEVGKELIKEGFILTKPTHYGLEISLNQKKSREIKRLAGIIH
ncbi:hypothetical protein A3K63_01660 [Candidatus Micrarchaeota archaeon RBG_16_49_10]|nr:MAG: hypothetical protein A3K63_01660 [Candidatus Micrarchaeota archaeon RBG_16_49_10]